MTNLSTYNNVYFWLPLSSIILVVGLFLLPLSINFINFISALIKGHAQDGGPERTPAASTGPQLRNDHGQVRKRYDYVTKINKIFF